VKVEKDELLIV